MTKEEEQRFEATKKAILCIKECVVSPFTEKVIGQIYTILKKRDEAALNYAQAKRLIDKTNYSSEVAMFNEQIKNLLFIP